MQLPTRQAIRRAALPAIVLLSLGIGAGRALADDAAPNASPMTGSAPGQERMQHRQEWMRHHLEQDANRLEIKASQQGVWQDFAKARMALAERSFGRPAQELDPAAMARLHADRAAEGARKLAVLADATAKLQAILSPEQRQTLVQMMHHGFRHHGHHGWMEGRDGEHGRDAGPRGPMEHRSDAGGPDEQASDSEDDGPAA
jgi:hypothetical protein